MSKVIFFTLSAAEAGLVRAANPNLAKILLKGGRRWHVRKGLILNIGQGQVQVT